MELWTSVVPCGLRRLSISMFPKLWDTKTSLHIICPKLLIALIPSQLEWIYLSPSRLESQTSVRQPTAKIFGSSPIQFEYQAFVRRPSLKLFGSRHSHLSFDRRKNCWRTSQPSVPWPLQPLTTHVLDVCHPPVTENKMSPFVCTAQN